MRFYLILFLLVGYLFAQDTLVIDANNFNADDNKNLVTFDGNVKVKKGQDLLNSEHLEVLMTITNTNEKTPKKYTATGNVDFLVYANEKIYIGKGTKVIYEPMVNRYTILGNGYLEEKTEGRILYGEEIYLNELSGHAEVKGSANKPVRFMMKIQENKNENN